MNKEWRTTKKSQCTDCHFDCSPMFFSGQNGEIFFVVVRIRWRIWANVHFHYPPPPNPFPRSKQGKGSIIPIWKGYPIMYRRCTQRLLPCISIFQCTNAIHYVSRTPPLPQWKNEYRMMNKEWRMTKKSQCTDAIYCVSFAHTPILSKKPPSSASQP